MTRFNIAAALAVAGVLALSSAHAGRFEESDDVGRSLSQDVRKHAKTEVPPGQGDRGDQKRRDG